MRHETANFANSSDNRYLYNGKEEQTTGNVGLLDYGARQYDALLARWFNVDPLAEEFISWGTYIYCLNNPVNMIDPDGKYGLRIINHENKTVTVTANYYVQTSDRMYYTRSGKNKYLGGYSERDVINMRENINGYLNGLNGKITEGDYAGYSIHFNLRFISGGTPENTHSMAGSDYYGDYLVGNSFGVGTEEMGGGHFPVGSTRGGYAQDNQHIMMNVPHDNLMNRVHEIFHTLGFTHPKGGGDHGIMNYPPFNPDKRDFNMIGNSDFLPEIEFNDFMEILKNDIQKALEKIQVF